MEPVTIFLGGMIAGTIVDTVVERVGKRLQNDEAKNVRADYEKVMRALNTRRTAEKVVRKCKKRVDNLQSALKQAEEDKKEKKVKSLKASLERAHESKDEAQQAYLKAKATYDNLAEKHGIDNVDATPLGDPALDEA